MHVSETDLAGGGDAGRQIYVAACAWSVLDSEVYMHIAEANFYLLSVTGPKMPSDWKEGMDKSVTSKAEVIAWLKRSLEAVKVAHVAETPNDLQRQSTHRRSRCNSGRHVPADHRARE